MFIVCPSCSGPYSIAADQIAPLVQVACPHCEYRVILDFEAANDPALREPGHQFAQGYESAEAYFSVYSHVTKNPDVKPFSAPGITGTGAAEIKTAVGETKPASPTTSSSTSSTTSSTISSSTSSTASSSPSSSISSTTPPNSSLFTALGQQPAGSSRNAKTVIHTGSKKPVPLDPASEPLAPRPKAPSGPTMHAGTGTEKLPEAPPPSITPATTPPVEPERRNPPHTPPVSNVSSAPPLAETKPEDPAAQSHSQLGEKTPEKPIEAPPVKMPEAIKPTETSSAKYIVIGMVVLLIIVVVVMLQLNKP